MHIFVNRCHSCLVLVNRDKVMRLDSYIKIMYFKVADNVFQSCCKAGISPSSGADIPVRGRRYLRPRTGIWVDNAFCTVDML